MHTTLLFASCSKAVCKPKNYTMKHHHALNTEDSGRARHGLYGLRRSCYFMGICFLTAPKASGRCFKRVSCLLSQVQPKHSNKSLYSTAGDEAGEWEATRITTDQLTKMAEKTGVRKYSCHLVTNRLSMCYLY